MNVICLKHSEYKGTTTPILSCKTCCGLFIAQVKAKTAVTVDPNQWLQDKSREHRTEEAPQRVNARFGFDPRFV